MFCDQTPCLIKLGSNNWHKPLSKRGTHAHVWYALSKRTKHRPSNTRTKEIFKLLIECLMAFKFYQTRPNTIKHDQTRSNTIKQHQTRCPNSNMFGHNTIFDGVWSPNISRLSRPLKFVFLLKCFNCNRIYTMSCTKRYNVMLYLNWVEVAPVIFVFSRVW